MLSYFGRKNERMDMDKVNLTKKIEDFIEMERRSCSMDVITPLYVSRMLNVPLEDVDACMKEMGL